MSNCKEEMELKMEAEVQAIERLQEKRMELERYVARLQEEERSLRDAIGHSTFLHRQIEFLTERFESLEHEVNLTKFRSVSLENALKEWKRLAHSHGILKASSSSSVPTAASQFQYDANNNINKASSVAQDHTAKLKEMAKLKDQCEKALHKLETLEKIIKDVIELPLRK